MIPANLAIFQRHVAVVVFAKSRTKLGISEFVARHMESF